MSNKMLAGNSPITYQQPNVAFAQSDLGSLQFYMALMMLRNITTAGYVIEDPVNPGSFSKPGCVIAAPSFPEATPGIDQDYVFNWVRDAAITALELTELQLPASGGAVEMLVDYTNFAALCFANAAPTKGHAVFRIGGDPRAWTEQNDGPALQTVALLHAFSQLDPATQATAKALINNNVAYLLANYQNPTFNLWEEHQGYSFFARAAQLRCFQAIAANTVGASIPPGLDAAISWLKTALQTHWNGEYYISVVAPGSNPPAPVVQGYDPNIDIVSASLYGAIACTDTKLLATAARLRSQWADSNSPQFYPINGADDAKGLGPLLGRYPGDIYDGDVSGPQTEGHPWALCTANFAELYYRLAGTIVTDKKIPLDDLSASFFSQIGISATTSVADAAAALRAAADRMLRAIVYHSDHYELSEQFDKYTGFEKSVSNLTWSYAAFLSALRARG
jgi:glucoamylase